MRVKFLSRFFCDKIQKLCKRKFVYVLVFLLLIWKKESIFVIRFCNPPQNECEKFDVVYTWVNGSDPDFLAAVQSFDPGYDPSRFDDKNELRYSLRSLEKYAPWVRHVYIVTNGQIPHWLNLECGKISIVSHELLVPDENILPTFSSAAIELFIHRIPNLSKRFLYLNDDIFLGAPLFPEDLYTTSEGVKVYTAWIVPDCAEDCPWVYVGDGSCDQNCNIEACQYDGGDCAFDSPRTEATKLSETHPYTVENLFYDIPKISDNPKQNSTIDEVPPTHPRASKRFFQKTAKHSFKELIRSGKNVSSDTELRAIVDNYNREQKKRHKVHRRSKIEEKSTITFSRDIYAQSLVYTNKLFNILYGFKSRKVLAHVGFLLDRDIIENMLNKFKNESGHTLGHRFRHVNDLQFAFAYYHFLMDETMNLSVSEIFDELDTDESSTWSDREIRTLLARIYPLPLDWAVVRYFEDVIINCSRESGLDQHDMPQYTTLVYERYEDSNIPTVTKDLVEKCSPLTEVLLENFSKRSKYRFHINQKTGMYSNFKMLTSNVSEVVDALDELRRNPKKFNCINDNLEIGYPEETQLAKYLLEDFYLSFFPRHSNFELPDHYRNRYKTISDYERWRFRRQISISIAYIFSAILLAIGLKFCCAHKAKYARKFIEYKCCDI